MASGLSTEIDESTGIIHDKDPPPPQGTVNRLGAAALSTTD
jgi:hypothetical protein